MINKKTALSLAKKVHLNLDVVGLDQWIDGLNTELEHGTKLGESTNITNNNKVITAMIALAHLIEDPKYYIRLNKMEEQAKKYWKGKEKPKVIINN
jgi:hypothetical protein